MTKGEKLKGLLKIDIRISKVEAAFKTFCLYRCFRLVLDLNPTVLSKGIFNAPQITLPRASLPLG